MSTLTTGSGHHVDVARWPGCLMSQREIAGTLSFLMHKMKKNVRCAPYRGSLQYAADMAKIYICTDETCDNPIPVDHVKLNATTHQLDSSQATFHLELDGSDIKDDDGRLLAKVDRNCVVILFDITAVDNEAGKAILAYVVEHAIPLLNFAVDDRLTNQKDTISKAYDAFHKAALRSRIDDKTEEVRRLERDTENYYYQLVQAERDLPVARTELQNIEKQAESKDNAMVEKQAQGILALITNGQYEEVTPAADGSLFARTTAISIDHDGWEFDLGRYEINIDQRGKISILSADGKEADGYPHPHIDGSGRPCLGNVSADLARAIGRMRMSEALTLLHDYLSSYNPDGPYIRLGKFDPEYNDPDDDPCDDCEDYHSPYCICECSHNEGNHSCSDCAEYRSDYCYQECSYNTPGFTYISPCDPCEESEEHCFLECQYNQKWEENNPCSDCHESCDGCEYVEKKERLASASHRKKPARAS